MKQIEVNISQCLSSTQIIEVPEDMEDYFSKDEELVANFDKLSNQMLKDGYIRLTDYLFYTDPGYDEGEEFDDDDGWEI